MKARANHQHRISTPQPSRKHHGHPTRQPNRQPAAPASPGMGWKRPVLLGVAVLLAFAGTWAVFELVIWNKLPAQLVGKWVVMDGPQEGATFDFFRNGTMVGTVNIQGREGIVKATVRVEGDKIFSTTRNPGTGLDDTRVQTIRSLTDIELVVEDGQGKQLRMRRASSL